MTSDSNNCVVGIRTASGGLVKGFDMCVIGEDVYTNYSDCSTPEYHSSYHKTGQLHSKRGGDYIKWTGGPTGQNWERCISRKECTAKVCPSWKNIPH